MKKKLKEGTMLLLSMVLAATLALAGCSERGTETNTPAAQESTQATAAPAEETTSEAKLEPVVLDYYYPTITPQNDLELVEAEMNKILQEKINATIKLHAMDWVNFEPKMNVMNSAGDAYDLVFTAPWLNNYFLNVAKDAYLPLDDLLEQYAPNFKSIIPDKVWNAARVNGKIYGAINYQIVAMPYGVSVRRDLAEKYNLDLSTIHKFEDLEPFFEQVKQNEPKMLYAYTLDFASQTPVFGMDTIGENKSPGYYYLNDPEVKVFNQYESPEFIDFVKLLISWQEKGYVTPNALNGLNPGEYSALFSKPMKPGWEAPDKVALQFDGVGSQFSKPLITTAAAISTMTAISRTSKNPERAMMYLELINTNKDLYNLLAHGIEGKHYVFVDKDNGVIGLPDGVTDDTVGYKPGVDWMFGNTFNGYYSSVEEVGNNEKTIEMNTNGDAAPLLGFSFDPEAIKTELAQTKAVVDEYYTPLLTGLLDVSKIDEFNKKLKDAGVDKIIQEKQKQVDAWLAANK